MTAADPPGIVIVKQERKTKAHSGKPSRTRTQPALGVGEIAQLLGRRTTR
jgi:hypothetical protein